MHVSRNTSHNYNDVRNIYSPISLSQDNLGSIIRYIVNLKVTCAVAEMYSNKECDYSQALTILQDHQGPVCKHGSVHHNNCHCKTKTQDCQDVLADCLYLLTVQGGHSLIYSRYACYGKIIGYCKRFQTVYYKTIQWWGCSNSGKTK